MNETLTYHCELIDRPAQPVLAIRTRTTIQALPAFVGEAYGAIAQYLGQLGQAPAGAPFAAYYNMDMQDLDMAAGFPVARPLPAQGKMQPGEIPGGRAAMCLHVGPYNQISAAYQALGEWMQAHGHEATGVAYEFYLNSPDEVPPEALQTQVVFPIK
jgi:effector-binding domain-containing protein